VECAITVHATLDEALRCANDLKDKLNLDQEDIERRFYMFGDSARFLFISDEDIPIKALEKALRQIKLDGLASALNPEGTNPSLSSKLVHINASADFSSMGER